MALGESFKQFEQNTILKLQDVSDVDVSEAALKSIRFLLGLLNVFFLLLRPNVLESSV